MYNVADDLSSPFMTTGRTVTHEEVVNGPNSTRTIPLPGQLQPVGTGPVSRPRLVPGNGPPDIGTLDRPGISPPTNPSPAPGDLSPVGFAPPVDPSIPGAPSVPSTPEDQPKNPIDRLIDLIGAQIAGGGTLGGTVALPTSTTGNNNSGAASAFILIVIVGVLGFLGWKMFRKKAA